MSDINDSARATELETLFAGLLNRPQRPTWITGRHVTGEACVRLAWADVELLRELLRNS